MAGKREIRAKEIVSDIIFGIEDRDLMAKYRLTFRGLQSVYRKLEVSRVIDPTYLKGRIVPQLHSKTTVVARPPRKSILLPLPVQDVADPEKLGTVTNVTERGLAVKGIAADVDDVRKFIIKPDQSFELMSFSLKAKCRWVKTADDSDEMLAGFETVAISQRDRQKLRNLIETLDYMYL